MFFLTFINARIFYSFSYSLFAVFLLYAAIYVNNIAKQIPLWSFILMQSVLQSVTLGDEEANRRGVQKTVLERKGPSTFSCGVEIISKTELRVHRSLEATVDAILSGIFFFWFSKTKKLPFYVLVLQDILKKNCGKILLQFTKESLKVGCWRKSTKTRGCCYAAILQLLLLPMKAAPSPTCLVCFLFPLLSLNLSIYSWKWGKNFPIFRHNFCQEPAIDICWFSATNNSPPPPDLSSMPYLLTLFLWKDVPHMWKFAKWAPRE